MNNRLQPEYIRIERLYRTLLGESLANSLSCVQTNQNSRNISRSILRSKWVLAAGFLTLAMATSVFSATITLGGSMDGSSAETTSLTGAVVVTFDNQLVPSAYILTKDAYIEDGSLKKIYLAPAGDSTPYLTTGAGAVTIDFSADPIEYFGLYWGSIDLYNHITFTNTLDQSYSYTGNVLAGHGFALNGTESEYVNFFSDLDERWNAVTLSSTSHAFEVDNVASSDAPEPASMLTVGLGISFAVLRTMRHKKR